MNGVMITARALNVSADTVYKAFSPEAWMKAIEVTVVGMGMIFAVLALLWGVLGLFKVFFAKDSGKKVKEKADLKKAVEVAVEETLVENVQEDASAAQDDGELIAVITAAIEAYRASEGGAENAGGFKVVSFRRASNARGWNRKGN